MSGLASPYVNKRLDRKLNFHRFFFFYKYEGKIYREVNLERVSPGLDFRMQTAFKRNERFFLWPAANGLFSWSVRGLLEGVNVKKREIVKPFLPLRPALTHI